MREPAKFEAPACASVGGDFWFPEKGGSQSTTVLAKTICSTCIHREECAEWGINNERHGIWGGLSERELSMARARRKIVLREEYNA